MTIAVVDRLEVVDVEHDQGQPMAIAPDLFGLEAQPLLEATMVTQPGLFIGNRLSLDLVVELDVLKRERRLRGE
jgi:hypothetical protein